MHRDPSELIGAVLSALALAREHGLKRVSLPAISSGIFGFPKDRCAAVMVEAVDGFTGLDEIRLCNIDALTTQIFKETAMVLAIDQILSLAVWISPDMLPVVSRTKTTSTTGRCAAMTRRSIRLVAPPSPA